MAIGTYAELQTAVANWLDRGDLTDRIQEFIDFAEARINRNLRLRLMETAATGTLTPELETIHCLQIIYRREHSI